MPAIIKIGSWRFFSAVEGRNRRMSLWKLRAVKSSGWITLASSYAHTGVHYR